MTSLTSESPSCCRDGRPSWHLPWGRQGEGTESLRAPSAGKGTATSPYGELRVGNGGRETSLSQCVLACTPFCLLILSFGTGVLHGHELGGWRGSGAARRGPERPALPCGVEGDFSPSGRLPHPTQLGSLGMLQARILCSIESESKTGIHRGAPGKALPLFGPQFPLSPSTKGESWT